MTPKATSKSAGSLFLIGARLASTVLSIVSIPFFLRRFGDDQYGLYLLTLVWAVYIAMADLGFANLMQRYVLNRYAEDPVLAVRDCIPLMTRNVLWLSVIALPVYLCLLPLVAKGVPSEIVWACAWGGCGFFFVNQLNRQLGFLLPATGQFAQLALSTGMGNTVAILLGILLATQFHSVAVILYGQIAGGLLTTALMIRALSGRIRGIHPLARANAATIADLKALMRVATPNMVLGAGSNQGDKFMVGSFVSQEMLTHYGVASKIPEALWDLMNPVTQTVAPEIARKARESEQALRDSLARNSVMILGTCVLMVVLPSATAPGALRAWLGTKYLPQEAIAMALVGIYRGIDVFNTFCGNTFWAVNRPLLCLPFTAFNSVITLGLSIPIARAFGLSGLGTMNAFIGLSLFFPLCFTLLRLGFSRQEVAPHVFRLATMLAGGLAYGTVAFFTLDWLGGHLGRFAILGATMAIYFLGVGLLVGSGIVPLPEAIQKRLGRLRGRFAVRGGNA